MDMGLYTSEKTDVGLAALRSYTLGWSASEKEGFVNK